MARALALVRIATFFQQSWVKGELPETRRALCPRRTATADEASNAMMMAATRAMALAQAG